MKRTAIKGKAAAKLPRAFRETLAEAETLWAAAGAFRELEADAKRLADRGAVRCDLSPGGRLARLAKRGARYAGGTLAGTDCPHPLGTLARVLAALRVFAGWRWWEDATAPIPERGGALWDCLLETQGFRGRELGEERLEARNLSPLPVAMAFHLAADCAAGRVAAEVAAAGAVGRALATEREAALRAKLAAVRGKKEEARKWRRTAKREREAVRALDAYRCAYVAGMTVSETAARLGVSVRTVETSLKGARDLLGIAPRPRGRRKRVEVETATGTAEAEAAEARDAARGWRSGDAEFYVGLDGEDGGGGEE